MLAMAATVVNIKIILGLGWLAGILQKGTTRACKGNNKATARTENGIGIAAAHG